MLITAGTAAQEEVVGLTSSLLVRRSFLVTDRRPELPAAPSPPSSHCLRVDSPKPRLYKMSTGSEALTESLRMCSCASHPLGTIGPRKPGVPSVPKRRRGSPRTPKHDGGLGGRNRRRRTCSQANSLLWQTQFAKGFLSPFSDAFLSRSILLTIVNCSRSSSLTLMPSQRPTLSAKGAWNRDEL